MKDWKAAIAGFLVFCLFVLAPFPMLSAEEEMEEQETEEEIPDSYYYPIESNEIEGWPQGPAIESAGAVVMDLDTGAFLYSKQAKEKMYPASITKIMTTLLLLENCDLDDTITFSGVVYDLEEGSSHLGIQPGEKMTLRDCAYGIMLASANDISNGVAEYIGGSLSGFADMMNERAAQIGCVNTHFSNPHGLYSEDHYTCAYDMALIAQEAYKNPVFREIAGTTEYTIPETNLAEERSFLNHHKMLQSDEEYYRDWCTGGKNGYTEDCLNTLVTFGEKDGMRLVSVVLRVNGAGKAYDESIQILEYAFSNFQTVKFEKKSTERTFYDIMGFGYPGEISKFLSPAWQRHPFEDLYVEYTLPTTAQASELTFSEVQSEGNYREFSYEYSGYPVGSAGGAYSTIYAPAQMVYERDVEVLPGADQVSASDNIQIQNLDQVLTQANGIFTEGFRIVSEYARGHLLTVLAAGFVLLAILIVFIVLLIFRCTADARIRRRRRLEEAELKQKEAEIEQMTAAEIEAELRAVMEQERMRKEQEELARAEAERAAEEARQMEEKAHETEKLLEELEKERQERLSSR